MSHSDGTLRDVCVIQNQGAARAYSATLCMVQHPPGMDLDQKKKSGHGVNMKLVGPSGQQMTPAPPLNPIALAADCAGIAFRVNFL